MITLLCPRDCRTVWSRVDTSATSAWAPLCRVVMVFVRAASPTRPPTSNNARRQVQLHYSMTAPTHRSQFSRALSHCLRRFALHCARRRSGKPRPLVAWHGVVIIMLQ